MNYCSVSSNTVFLNSATTSITLFFTIRMHNSVLHNFITLCFTQYCMRGFLSQFAYLRFFCLNHQIGVLWAHFAAHYSRKWLQIRKTSKRHEESSLIPLDISKLVIVHVQVTFMLQVVSKCTCEQFQKMMISLLCNRDVSANSLCYFLIDIAIDLL